MKTAGIDSNNAFGRPPFVRFALRSVEDRNQTIEQGHYVGRDVAYALITPRGSKDVHEEIAEEWLVKMEQEVREERFPSQWLESFRSAYRNFVAGSEAVVDGTSLREWPVIRPAQLATCHAVSIFSVEDLAAANEEAVSSLGMGGRQLREQAKNWLAAAKDIGVPTAKIQALEGDNAALRARNDSLETQMRTLMSRMEILEQGGTGGKPTPTPTNDLLDPPAPKPTLKKI
jgi:hypothetical protein